MKFQKHLRSFLSYLLLSVFSISLLTGCAKEDIELAATVVTAVLETEFEEGDFSSEGS